MEMGENDKNIERLDSLTDALGRSDGQSLEEVKEDLKSEGIDLDSSLKRLMETVHKSSRAARRKMLDRAREERLKTDAKEPTTFGKFANWTREELIGKIREILSTAPVAINVSFRDLESKHDEDLASLLEDLERAKQIENKEKSNA
jgi:hypothetical protein